MNIWLSFIHKCLHYIERWCKFIVTSITSLLRTTYIMDYGDVIVCGQNSSDHSRFLFDGDVGAGFGCPYSAANVRHNFDDASEP